MVSIQENKIQKIVFKKKIQHEKQQKMNYFDFLAGFWPSEPKNGPKLVQKINLNYEYPKESIEGV